MSEVGKVKEKIRIIPDQEPIPRKEPIHVPAEEPEPVKVGEPA
jgi:hypothetical protein